MELIKPRECQTWKRFLVHCNIPKRAIPRMVCVRRPRVDHHPIEYRRTANLARSERRRHDGLERGTDNKRGMSMRAPIEVASVNQFIL
jgi:hypothetical protein